jgi:SOS response regulatory protein OraA/RecX
MMPTLKNKWLKGKHAGQGAHYLTRKFKFEGFNGEKISALNQNTTDEHNDLDLVITYLKSKKKNLLANLDTPELKIKEKIYRHLLYKGHSYSFVDKIWKKLTSELID